MIKMIKITGILFLLCAFSPLHAQIYSGGSINPKVVDMIRRGLVTEREAYLNVVGDPFVDKEFTEGDIIFKDSTKVTHVPMRLNTYSDQIEFKYNDTIKRFTQPEMIDYVTFGHRSFMYSPYKEGLLNKKGYFEILAWGNCKLLFRRESIIKREQLPASDFEGGNFRDYFRTTEEYYIKKDDNPAVKHTRTKKGVTKALGDHEKELLDYISKHRTKLKKEDDLIDLIYYYNSLSHN